MQHVSASYWSACIFSTIGKHTLACNRHEIKCFFTAGEHWSKVPLSLFAAQYSDFTCLWISSSAFNDAFIHTPRYFTWSKNCTRTPFRKTLDGAGYLYFFWAKKNTNCFVTIKSDFEFSSTVTTNIQKILQPTNTGAEHTYIISKH